MAELLPLAIGCLCGVMMSRLTSRARRILVVPTALVAGVIASAVNGELENELWAVFVSLDAVLVWAGVAAGTLASWYWRRSSSAA